MRIIAAAFAIDVAAQPVLAGSYLSGRTQALAQHETNAVLVLALALAQFIAALLYRIIGRGRRWPVFVSATLIAVVTLQWAIAYDQMLYVHLPLGVLIVCGQVVIAVGTFTRSSGVCRRRLRRASKHVGSQHFSESAGQSADGTWS